MVLLMKFCDIFTNEVLFVIFTCIFHIYPRIIILPYSVLSSSFIFLFVPFTVVFGNKYRISLSELNMSLFQIILLFELHFISEPKKIAIFNTYPEYLYLTDFQHISQNLSFSFKITYIN